MTSPPTTPATPVKRPKTSIPDTFQTVFRLAGTRRSVVKQRANEDSQLGTPVLQLRRSHQKSRAGCQSCKARRIKCDERRPGCSRCRQHGVDCHYAYGHDDHKVPPTDAAATSLMTANAASKSFAEDTHAIEPGLQNRLICGPYPTAAAAQGIPSWVLPHLQSLRHFQDHTCSSVTSTAGQRVYVTSVMAMAGHNDYLMHAVLGTAAAHLTFLTKTPQLESLHRRYRCAEAYHWQKAMRGFRQALQTPGGPRKREMDTLISTGMLVGLHLYVTTISATTVSFIDSPLEVRAEALQWLRLQAGFRVIIGITGFRIAESVWADLLHTAEPMSEEKVRLSKEQAQMSADFLELCGIGSASTPANNHYLTALQDLLWLHDKPKPDMEDFAQYVAFAGRLERPFQDLLVQRDPAALLILAHWLTKMHQLGMWWIRTRAIQECHAILRHLHDVSDARVQRLLQFPASVFEHSTTPALPMAS